MGGRQWQSIRNSRRGEGGWLDMAGMGGGVKGGGGGTQ
jgi:hypothetical protein